MVPATVVALAEEHVGTVHAAERLAGLSHAEVWRLDGADGSLVAKGGVHPREHAAYTRDLLPGVRIPRCVEAYDDGRVWLLLEHLPRPLPAARWGPDREVVATLRTLHGLDPGLLRDVPDPFRPSWDEDRHARARQRLRVSPAATATLDVVRRAAQPLLAPRCVVSGDPNPLNWRLDDDDRPVLLDWERLGSAHPAVDLAIALPGLPTYAEANGMVSAYGDDAVRPVDLLIAKAWTLVEFADDAGDHDGRADVLARLAPRLDGWLADLDARLPRV